MSDEHTGGYAGARERLAQRYGMNENDFRRMGPQVMKKLAQFALKQENSERSHQPGRAKGAHIGAVLAMLLACCFASLQAHAQINCNASPSPCATVTGFLTASNGVSAADFTLTFQPSQMFFVAGTGVAIPTSTTCATSHDGSIVGIPNPLFTTSVSTAFSGTLPASTYYLFYTFYTTSPTQETLPSPEQSIQLNSTGQIVVQPAPNGIPSNALGMKIYIGATSGAETLQGSTVGFNTFTQSTPLVVGATAPASNTSSCKQVANDAGWPTGTGYQVTLTDQSGNTYPGYPMLWQLLGPGTTINISSGLPYYHGVVTFPTPLLAQPLNHAPQSVAGPLGVTGAFTGSGGGTLSGGYTLNGPGSANTVTLLNSQGPVTAITGNGADQNLYTYSIPGNTIGASKGFRVKFAFQKTAGSASTTYRLKLGSTTLFTWVSNFAGLTTGTLLVMNATGVQNAQWFMGQVLEGTAIVTNQQGVSAVESLATTDAISLTFNVANTDQVTPKMWVVEIVQ